MFGGVGGWHIPGVFDLVIILLVRRLGCSVSTSFVEASILVLLYFYDCSYWHDCDCTMKSNLVSIP